jgi:hypothetical protein
MYSRSHDSLQRPRNASATALTGLARHNEQSVRAPSGSFSFAATLRATASAAELSALAVDLPRLRLMDPRLCAAGWGDDGAQTGSTARITFDVAFSHAWVAHAIGEQRGVVRVIELIPARQVTYLIESGRGVAGLQACFDDGQAGCTVGISGWVLPHRARTRAGLRLLRPVIVRLIDRSLNRTIARASAFLSTPEMDN